MKKRKGYLGARRGELRILRLKKEYAELNAAKEASLRPYPAYTEDLTHDEDEESED